MTPTDHEKTGPELQDRNVVAGLAHGLAVIQAFNRLGATRLTQSQVSQATGLTRSTARRSLLTLKALGFVDADQHQYYVTPKVMELASTYLNSGDRWIKTVVPFLESLRNVVEENVSAVVLDRTDVVYVACYPANTVMALNVKIGDRRPAFCTAMGRVLLSTMPEECVRATLERSDIRQHTRNTITDIDDLIEELRLVREQGYAVVDQELESGLIAVAVPITNLRGNVIAALNICAHNMQSSLDRLLTVGLPEARRAIRTLSAHLP